MYRKCIVLVAGLTPLVLGLGIMTAQEKTAQEKTGKDPKRDADRAAIDKLVKEMVHAFNSHDAAGIVANWTAEGEFIRNDGDPIRGRAEVQKGYADYFKTLKGKTNVAVQVDNLRFVSADTAVSEITLRLKNDEGEVVASSWRDTLLVREDGRWKVAMVREWDRDTALDTSLTELQWLIGTWEAAGKEKQVTLNFEWDENKVFIRSKYTVTEKGKVVESGKQMIGKDNSEVAIRSWVFQSDGGFGGGVWAREGNKWTVDVYGVRADGSVLTATSIYIRLNDNAFTWQAVEQALDGIPIPDSQPIKVTKQKSAKSGS